MRKMFLFMMTSLDGFVEGPDHDLSWHNVDEEFNTFAAEQLENADTIVFGRRTYQLMESYWPSQEGIKDDLVVAKYMNETPKVVFSHTLENVTETDNWKHVKLANDHVAAEIARLKEREGKGIVALGSNNLCVTLIELGLLDEVRIMVNPVVIGQGTPLFAGIKDRVNLTLTKERTFQNGNILLYYDIMYK